MAQPCFESDVVTVHWDAAARTVVLAWKTFAKGEGFREGLEKGLELVQEKRAKRWIGDCRELGPVGREDQDWVNTDWFPRLIGTGLTHMAVIIPKSALSKMSVNSIMNKVEGTDFVSCNFATVEDGLDWVQGKKQAA